MASPIDFSGDNFPPFNPGLWDACMQEQMQAAQTNNASSNTPASTATTLPGGGANAQGVCDRCRRHKFRCDRIRPCQRCIKDGQQAECLASSWEDDFGLGLAPPKIQQGTMDPRLLFNPDPSDPVPSSPVAFHTMMDMDEQNPIQSVQTTTDASANPVPSNTVPSTPVPSNPLPSSPISFHNMMDMDEQIPMQSIQTTDASANSPATTIVESPTASPSPQTEKIDHTPRGCDPCQRSRRSCPGDRPCRPCVTFGKQAECLKSGQAVEPSWSLQNNQANVGNVGNMANVGIPDPLNPFPSGPGPTESFLFQGAQGNPLIPAPSISNPWPNFPLPSTGNQPGAGIPGLLGPPLLHHIPFNPVPFLQGYKYTLFPSTKGPGTGFASLNSQPGVYNPVMSSSPFNPTPSDLIPVQDAQGNPLMSTQTINTPQPGLASSSTQAGAENPGLYSSSALIPAPCNTVPAQATNLPNFMTSMRNQIHTEHPGLFMPSPSKPAPFNPHPVHVTKGDALMSTQTMNNPQFSLTSSSNQPGGADLALSSASAFIPAQGNPVPSVSSGAPIPDTAAQQATLVSALRIGNLGPGFTYVTYQLDEAAKKFSAAMYGDMERLMNSSNADNTKEAKEIVARLRERLTRHGMWVERFASDVQQSIPQASRDFIDKMHQLVRTNPQDHPQVRAAAVRRTAGQLEWELERFLAGEEIEREEQQEGKKRKRGPDDDEKGPKVVDLTMM